MDTAGRTGGSISARIRAEILASGPLRFDRFMDLALNGAGGYYERPPVGPAGDFVTSPHVHPIFGALLARGIRELWDHLERPDPFRLVEIGGGDGTLLRHLLDHLGDLPLEVRAVEASAGARDALREILGVEVVEAVGDEPHLVLGHELLDNLPFRLLRGGKEVHVGLEGDRFVRVELPAGRDLPTEADRVARTVPDAAEEIAVPTGAVGMIEDLARVIRHGYALFVDYGGDAGGGGRVHGYRGHRSIEDVLAEPGTADITAGVDFGLLADAAVAGGLQAFPSVTQRRALAALGFEAWMRDELATQGSLLNRGEGMEAVRRWAGRSRASILADPAQLGRLRWFVVASPGLPRPSFLEPEPLA